MDEFSTDKKVVEVDDSLLTDNDAVIRVVQKKRLEAILNDKAIDQDFLVLLRDTVKTSIDVKRLVSDNSNANADREIVKSTIEALGKLGKDFVRNLPPANRSFSVEDLPDIETVEGQMDTEQHELSYNAEDFEKK